MTMTVQFDDGKGGLVYGGDLGTTKAWGNFSRWVDSLPLEGHEALVTLVEHGWTNDPEALKRQLGQALGAAREITANVRHTGEVLLAAFERMPAASEGAYVSGA